MRAATRNTACIAGLVFLGIAVSSMANEALRTERAPGLGDYNTPFFPGGTYRRDVRSPSEFLGRELGSWPAEPSEVLSYFSYLADVFPNASLFEYGETYEGRKLIYLALASEENSGRLANIRDSIAKLHDPRRIESDREAREIVSNTPAVAWMGYAIHGDELSSTDAALQVAYQLLAGTDSISAKIRERVIVCIDPLQNPDGRSRWIKQLEQWNSVVTNPDVQSFHHRGAWPWGRGNHYLFDLNRDWFSLVHPESRGKVRAVLDWSPQFVVDAHEMGPHDTYLFPPPREPFNPFMISQIFKWWNVFARDQAAAFDRYGWSYYTREWNEEFFPGYGSSWATYIGAIGILYEQAGVDGSQMKRPDGTVMTYRETVHHQFVSSIANLTTVADNRRALLEDYYNEQKRAVGRSGGDRRGTSPKAAAFVFPPAENVSRVSHLAATLRRQDIEIEEATEAFTLNRARAAIGGRTETLKLPQGTLIVKLAQPNRRLIEAVLTYDIRLPTEFLKEERKALLKKNESKLYDATGWSLPLAYAVISYYTDNLPGVKTRPYEMPVKRGGVAGASPVFGYVFSGADDNAFALLGRLFERGYRVWGAKKPFEIGGRKFPRGSFLIKRSANPKLDETELRGLAEDAGVEVLGVNTALAASGADLGGSEFVLLHAPRIAVIGGSAVSTYSFGSVWHLLDSRHRTRVTTLDGGDLANTDLRKYNVLVLPSVSGPPEKYNRILGEDGLQKLKAWVESGGTLVAIGEGSAFLADTSVALGSVRQKRQVLKNLRDYEAALAAGKEAEQPVVDSLDLWEPKPKGGSAKKAPAAGRSATTAETETVESPEDSIGVEQIDETARKLRPRGAILAARVDADHWLAFGVSDPLPVLVNTTYAYVAKEPVEVAARFAAGRNLRLSGLLWPEARDRWSETIYSSREKKNHGQVILFAGEPNFRGYFYGSQRMLLNALFLGPGFGTSPTVEW